MKSRRTITLTITELKRRLFADDNPGMAIAAPVLVIGFVVFTIINPSYADSVFTAAKNFIAREFGWFYIYLMSALLVLAVLLSLSPAAKIKLGKDDELPEFNMFQWFSMLFGAGLGIGILFYSIAEPMIHMQANPFIGETEQMTEVGAQVGMRLSLFHWGLHGWAIYVVLGMALAYSSFRRGLPLSIRSTLYTIFGDRIYGSLGFLADLLAVAGTVFGIATSLGLGVQQINAGLNYLSGIRIDIGTQILLIAIISIIATISALTGVKRGIRILSVLNMRLTLLILLTFFILGPTSYLITALYQNSLDYIVNLPSLSVWVDPDTDSTWQGTWTIFYWGWWIAWAPFVSMFIARISRGRTIREFVVGVLLAPTILAIVWLTIFGNTAMFLELYSDAGIASAVNKDVSTALFTTIESMQAGTITTIIIATVCVALLVTYFITSADSATLVICTLISMGNPNPTPRLRIFWGAAIGAVAAALLFAGGLDALRTASILAALPFSIVVILASFSLCNGLLQEIREHDKTSAVSQ